MVEVYKKKGETFESLLRRFKQKLQLSGKLLEAKKVRFKQKELNKTAKKRTALRRLELQKFYEELVKSGKQIPPKTSLGALYKTKMKKKE